MTEKRVQEEPQFSARAQSEGNHSFKMIAVVYIFIYFIFGAVLSSEKLRGMCIDFLSTFCPSMYTVSLTVQQPPTPGVHFYHHPTLTSHCHPRPQLTFCLLQFF